jgi:hypothetical protein
MSARNIVLGVLAVLVAAAGAALITGGFSSRPEQNRPALAALPSLQPLAGNSTVLAPTAIALTPSATRSRRKRRAISLANRRIRSDSYWPMRNSASA